MARWGGFGCIPALLSLWEGDGKRFGCSQTLTGVAAAQVSRALCELGQPGSIDSALESSLVQQNPSLGGALTAPA